MISLSRLIVIKKTIQGNLYHAGTKLFRPFTTNVKAYISEKSLAPREGLHLYFVTLTTAVFVLLN